MGGKVAVHKSKPATHASEATEVLRHKDPFRPGQYGVAESIATPSKAYPVCVEEISMLESYVQSRERLLVTNQDTRRGANPIQKLGGVLLSFPTKKQKPKAWDEGRNRKGRLLLKGHIRIIGDYGYEELPVLSCGFWIIDEEKESC